jgi:predicted DNA-binding transcriptional regulator AlpA
MIATSLIVSKYFAPVCEGLEPSIMKTRAGNSATNETAHHEIRPLLSSKDVAKILKCSKNTVDKWRLYGGGPKFVRVGKSVRYSPREIEAYIARSTAASTSDEASPPKRPGNGRKAAAAEANHPN